MHRAVIVTLRSVSRFTFTFDSLLSPHSPHKPISFLLRIQTPRRISDFVGPRSPVNDRDLSPRLPPPPPEKKTPRAPPPPGRGKKGTGRPRHPPTRIGGPTCLSFSQSKPTPIKLLVGPQAKGSSSFHPAKGQRRPRAEKSLRTGLSVGPEAELEWTQSTQTRGPEQIFREIDLTGYRRIQP